MVKLTVGKRLCAGGILFVTVLFSFTAVRPTMPLLVKQGIYSSLVAKNIDSSNIAAGRYAKFYDSLGLGIAGLSRPAFDYAIKGYNYLVASGKIKNDGVLSIIDFSLPSNYKRLFVIDLKACCVLFNTYVSHGRNSGKEVASNFSNSINSFKTSLGFYITSGTYKGKHGYSLRLEGEEQGINDNALNRGIVMHSAAYVSEDFIKRQGYIGRSEGCPAVPYKLYKPIIERIKDGSCLFMYSTDVYYISHSVILKNTVTA